ncbi:MAG: hypothetical protein ABI779_25540 [Acidobacteriota bacterium]
MRQIARDPFARHTLVREVVRPLHAHQTCGFCSGIRVTPRSRDPFLYRYGTEPDAIRTRVSWRDGTGEVQERLGALLLDARGRIIAYRAVRRRPADSKE